MLAYLVIGPEASGTKFLTQCLLAATAGFGDDTHDQRLGNTDELQLPEAFLPDTIVLRRSMPHGKAWPRLNYLIAQLESAGYTVKVLLILRDAWLTVRSQIRSQHVFSEEEAIRNIRVALEYAFMKLSIYPTVVTYESLLKEKSRVAFFKSIGLEPPEVEVIDGNSKYLDFYQAT